MHFRGMLGSNQSLMDKENLGTSLIKASCASIEENIPPADMRVQTSRKGTQGEDEPMVTGKKGHI